MTSTSGNHTHVGGRAVGKGNPVPAELGFFNREPWMAQSRCASAPDPDLWFATDEDPTVVWDIETEAVAVCRTCPVRVECLNYKLENEIDHGVWGGVRSGRALKTYERKLRLLRKQRAEMGL